MKRLLLFSLFLSFEFAMAQTSHNTSLIGNLNYGRFTNDVWGYTDESGSDYAIVGLIDGVSVVRVSTSDLEEIDFIPGVQSTWRDIKTHDHYAYVTADQGGGGLTILDLSALPDSVRFVGTYTTTFTNAHNLYIADGFAYISGSNGPPGADILDLANPEAPVSVGQWETQYFHDIIVRNDTLFASAGSRSSVMVLDVSDKSNPNLITELPFPDGGYSHNAWITEDGHYLMTTQETAERSVKMWDIRDIFNPEIVHEYLASPSLLAHNAHILGDYAYISHYGDGLRIVDISEREHLVEVGYYDTFPDESEGSFEGNWGAFPFTASGLVYATDEDHGLFVVEFNGRRGSRLRGQVLNSQTSQPVPDITVEIVELGRSTVTDLQGDFKVGFPDPGTYTVSAYGFFYDTTSITVEVAEGETILQDIMIEEKPTGDIMGKVVDDIGNGIEGVQILLLESAFDLVVSQSDGGFEFEEIPEGSYSTLFGKWGHRIAYEEISVVSNQINEPEISLTAGFEDDFELDLGWVAGNGAANPLGPWQRLRPEDIGFGLPFHPEQDVTPGSGSHAYFARALGSEITLTTPTFDLTGDENAGIRYFLHWLPRGQNRDSLVVEISDDGGFSWSQIEDFSEEDATDDWRETVHEIPSSVMRTSQMKIRFTSKERGSGSSFALIDDFEVLSNVTNVDEPVASIPQEYTLDQNYPNPFNAGTAIRYSLPERTQVSLTVYNVIGQEITTLVDGVQKAGAHQVNWDGKDNSGRTVASGIYLYRLKTEGFSQTNKMILVQ